MREALYEESAACARSNSEAKIYAAFHVVGILLFAVAALWLLFSYGYISTIVSEGAQGGTLAMQIVIWFAFPAVFAGGGVCFFFLKRRFNVSYDYSFVEDELRITKVFNGKQRKFLFTLKADQILKLGKCDAESFGRTKQGVGKPKYLTANRTPCEGKDFYYLLYSTSLGKNLYVLECREILLEFLVRAAGRNKWERE